MLDSNKNKTVDYVNYEFDFESDGVFKLIDDENVYIGTWRSLSNKLELNFSNYEQSVKEIELFNQYWLESSFSDSLIELKSFDNQTVFILKKK